MVATSVLGLRNQAAAGCRILPELRAPWEAMNIPQNQHPGMWCEIRELRGGMRPESGQAVDVPETGSVLARYSGGCPLGWCLRARCLRPTFGNQLALLTGESLATQVWGHCELEQPGGEGLLAFQRRNCLDSAEKKVAGSPQVAGEDSGRRQLIDLMGGRHTSHTERCAWMPGNPNSGPHSHPRSSEPS